MLIELADRRTERRGSKTLDLNSEFLMALQYLCMELRWSWRRKTSIFQLRPGQWQYDLSLVPQAPTNIAAAGVDFIDGPTSVPMLANYTVANPGQFSIGDMAQVVGVNSSVGTPADFFNGTYPVIAVTPSPTITLQIGMTPGQSLGHIVYNGTGGTMVDTVNFSMANAADINQFVKHGVHYYPNLGAPNPASPTQPNPGPPQCGEITPLFERDLQTAAIYKNTYYPTPGYPRQYFMMPGMFLVLCITPVPTGGWPITIDYWSCPNVSLDSLAEQIPLVPAYLHHVLLKRLEAQIFRYTLGEGAAKYQAAMSEYSALVAKYSAQDTFAPGEHIDYSADDDYESNFANAQNAVQSTR
jgi:hypothetical protein